MSTIQQIDGFEIDLNRITRREFYHYIREMARIQGEAGNLEADLVTGELMQKVIISWPFEAKITADNYLDLPLHDARRVDLALEEAIATLTKKK